MSLKILLYSEDIVSVGFIVYI